MAFYKGILSNRKKMASCKGRFFFFTRREFKARWRRRVSFFFWVLGSFTREEIIVRGLFLRTPMNEDKRFFLNSKGGLNKF